MKKLLLATLLAAAPLAFAANDATTNTARNKENALAFYELVFNQHKVQEAVDKYIAEPYIQHNPSVGDGGAAFAAIFIPFLKEHPQSHAEIKRVIAEGDVVALHVFIKHSPDERGEAVVDIFRFNDDGKIVEHWDVVQSIPAEMVHKNGMF